MRKSGGPTVTRRDTSSREMAHWRTRCAGCCLGGRRVSIPRRLGGRRGRAPRGRRGKQREDRGPVRRWLLPVAAAAVVVALVVTVLTLRGQGSPAGQVSPGPASGATNPGSGSPGKEAETGVASLASAPSPAAQQAIPAGMQAVDALGVEIFVSADLTLDPPCAAQSVSRPTYGLTYLIGCGPVQAPMVWITTAAAAAIWNNDPPATTCANSVRLDGEAGRLTVTDPTPNVEPAEVTATIIWPRHDIAVIAEFPAGQRTQALAVAQSAHWVPVDRHGCAATRSPVVPADAGSLPAGSVLPADATSTSACWYSDGRLVASATLPPTAADGLEDPRPAGNAPGLGIPAPAYTPTPDGPSCNELGRTEGIVFQATRPDGSIAVSAAQFADCTGGQYWTDGTYAQPVDEALASAIYRAAGFLLVFGYHPTPLDPPAAATIPASSQSPTVNSSGPPVASATGPSTAAAPTTVPTTPVTSDTPAHATS